MQDQDSYMLKAGNFLRKTSLDEIPQLFNIIKGDIAFIGPRPALYNQKDLIALRNKYNINSLKPGITGLAQVNGRDSLSIEQKVKYDYKYLKNKSFKLDCIIMCKTIIKVLLARDIK
jgi:O-antigen biosynthesis protein WbqP